MPTAVRQSLRCWVSDGAGVPGRALWRWHLTGALHGPAALLASLGFLALLAGTVGHGISIVGVRSLMGLVGLLTLGTLAGAQSLTMVPLWSVQARIPVVGLAVLAPCVLSAAWLSAGHWELLGLAEGMILGAVGAILLGGRWLSLRDARQLVANPVAARAAFADHCAAAQPEDRRLGDTIAPSVATALVAQLVRRQSDVLPLLDAWCAHGPEGGRSCERAAPAVIRALCVTALSTGARALQPAGLLRSGRRVGGGGQSLAPHHGPGGPRRAGRARGAPRRVATQGPAPGIARHAPRPATDRVLGLARPGTSVLLASSDRATRLVLIGSLGRPEARASSSS